MKYYASTHTGKVRIHNEDCYLVHRLCGLVAVADGIGGHLAGEVASRIATEQLLATLLPQGPIPNESLMREAFERANTEIYEQSQRDAQKRGMGTTLTALWFAHDHVLLAHVGDSRAYLLRDGILMQMTRDHSLVAELLECGEITKEEAAVHPRRNIITRALGTARTEFADISTYDVRKGDVWLLCSDGLSDYVTDIQMHDELSKTIWQGGTFMSCVQTLHNLAMDGGGRDNITLVITTPEEEAQS